jgi:N-acetylmuramoyl-L-alanine amidase
MGLATLSLLAFALSACRSTPVSRPGANVPAPEIKRDSRTAKIVCIDPGHPSEVSSGAVVQNGVTEVHIAWVVALKLQKILEAEGLRVVMTKSREDELVTNRERASIANQAGAALMVRLHCDTGRDEGLALYFPDRQATKDGTTGPSLDVIRRSKDLAATMHTEIMKSLRGTLKDGGLRPDAQTAVGSQQGGALTGSIFSQVPTVLIEIVVLSNKADAEFIKSEAGQQKMAQAIADGISVFVGLPG